MIQLKTDIYIPLIKLYIDDGFNPDLSWEDPLFQNFENLRQNEKEVRTIDGKFSNQTYLAVYDLRSYIKL